MLPFTLQPGLAKLGEGVEGIECVEGVCEGVVVKKGPPLRSVGARRTRERECEQRGALEKRILHQVGVAGAIGRNSEAFGSNTANEKSCGEGDEGDWWFPPSRLAPCGCHGRITRAGAWAHFFFGQEGQARRQEQGAATRTRKRQGSDDCMSPPSEAAHKTESAGGCEKQNDAVVRRTKKKKKVQCKKTNRRWTSR